MHVPLKELTYLGELDFFKIIISSADRFPGLYRILSSWRNNLHQNQYLKLLSFLEAVHRTEKGHSWTRAEWLAAHELIFDLSYGAESRNEQRQDERIKEILRQRGRDWFESPTSLSLALIDNVNPVEEIEVDQTYYMMGSLLRFEKDKVLVSHDGYTGAAYAELAVSYTQAREYIESVFSRKSLGDLFLKSEIVAHLDFNQGEKGQLLYNKQYVEELIFKYPGNCPLFATVNYNEILPIRFAKLIGVSNVCG